MEYFLMKPYEDGCKLKVVNNDPDIIICKVTKKGDMPDFAIHPIPLISDRFKELLEQYLPSMEFSPCLLEGKGKPDFWAFTPRELDTELAVYEPDGSVKAVAPMGFLPIFAVPNYKKVSYVVNRALAESLLRRGYVNVTLERIETLEVEDER